MIAAAAPVLASVGGKSFWYLTRGSGVVSLVLLTISVVLGVLASGRWESKRWPRFVIQGLHRNISLVVLVFLAIHIATTVLDGFVPITWLDAIIPFTSGYRPVWVGLGALALDCLLAIIITSLLRVRIGERPWRAVHWLAYLSWPIALVHGLGTGTDTRSAWMLALDAVAIGSVLVAVWWRVAARRPAHPVAVPVALAASAVVPLVIVAFAWTGPMRTGWSSHGARLGGPAARTAATTPRAASLPLPIVAPATGTRTAADTDSGRTVAVDLRTTSPPLAIRIDLVGSADATGGVTLDHGTVTVLPASGASWIGPVTALKGDVISARLQEQAPGGAKATFTARLAIDRTTGAVSGTVTLRSTRAAGGH